MRPTLLSAALVAALPVAPLAAQVATVDEGSFSITRNGAPAGREEFSIRRTPSGAEGGAVYVASSASIGPQSMKPRAFRK